MELNINPCHAKNILRNTKVSWYFCCYSDGAGCLNPSPWKTMTYLLSIPWLQMSWLLASPAHQQQWYWLCYPSFSARMVKNCIEMLQIFLLLQISDWPVSIAGKCLCICLVCIWGNTLHWNNWNSPEREICNHFKYGMPRSMCGTHQYNKIIWWRIFESWFLGMTKQLWHD